jgi:hypothetical protein
MHPHCRGLSHLRSDDGQARGPPLPAALDRRRDGTPASSSATPTVRRSHSSTMSRSRGGARRRTCSPAANEAWRIAVNIAKLPELLQHG